ncbi:ribonuclease toxin immunity protein CdiI, partial [Pectobacterium versatile]|nr:ribonuclease toxin immunity protein CdiI [Pectobacterium versatile]
MSQELFGQPYDNNDPHWIIKAYFDRMYNDGYFGKAISYILHKDSFHVDGAYCSFPDMNSYYEEEHFEGVEFAYGY